MIAYLVEAGADPNARAMGGVTPCTAQFATVALPWCRSCCVSVPKPK